MWKIYRREVFLNSTSFPDVFSLSSLSLTICECASPFMWAMPGVAFQSMFQPRTCWHLFDSINHRPTNPEPICLSMTVTYSCTSFSDVFPLIVITGYFCYLWSCSIFCMNHARGCTSIHVLTMCQVPMMSWPMTTDMWDAYFLSFTNSFLSFLLFSLLMTHSCWLMHCHPDSS